mmetsp:Transcript_25996/g.66925  ORF Transcript_25996/g.66925 Transcript_25996/m.66925 type:complete len:219 (+) Transcript_25996:211-867(+)
MVTDGAELHTAQHPRHPPLLRDGQRRPGVVRQALRAAQLAGQRAHRPHNGVHAVPRVPHLRAYRVRVVPLESTINTGLRPVRRVQIGESKQEVGRGHVVSALLGELRGVHGHGQPLNRPITPIPENSPGITQLLPVVVGLRSVLQIDPICRCTTPDDLHAQPELTGAVPGHLLHPQVRPLLGLQDPPGDAVSTLPGVEAAQVAPTLDIDSNTIIQGPA